jgi:2-keto-4-pentenoate hydratase/2-oxohepta-3-ene-1,7-dioic acid hydratase in catechol pathway
MRLLTYRTADGPAAAIDVDDTLVPARALDAPASSVRGLFEALDDDGLRELAARAADAEERIPLADATLCAPIPDPRKVICIGLNYRDHAEQTGQDIPAAPMWFAKFADSLTGRLVVIGFRSHQDGVRRQSPVRALQRKQGTTNKRPHTSHSPRGEWLKQVRPWCEWLHCS